ncbi:MAG: ornithine carbamoyltransferase [Armatimonadota bacterium]|nr:ornithine carbamoyltransferase [Armatimonadota bacterium]MDR5704011.1 ornithine carbamoyltransferase [Armatimonadota bacterium]MDR7433917.1 ornithine carbamoyltransferase [Armatimonadota bacterium]
MAPGTLQGRDLLSMDDLSVEELWMVLDLALDLKARMKAGERPPLLQGKTLAMIFEKPSLRTRVTFEVGMWQLGGTAVYLAPQDVQLGVRESVADVARNLARWVDGIAARTFRHATVEELAKHAEIPVINALSDLEHPCQVIADLLTIYEKRRRLEGLRIAWIGDGNNVCHSLLLGAAKMGMHIVVATPEGYAPREDVVERAQTSAARSGGRIQLTQDPREAASGADIIYTDVWVSMGQEEEREVRLQVFRPYQVNQALLALANKDVLVMHCLPAHRGEEITDDVLDGPHSVVLDEAENRLHAQKALLALLLR